jgi:hypothetical protein
MCHLHSEIRAKTAISKWYITNCGAQKNILVCVRLNSAYGYIAHPCNSVQLTFIILRPNHGVKPCKPNTKKMVTNLVNFSMVMLVSVSVTEQRRMPVPFDSRHDLNDNERLNIVYNDTMPGKLNLAIADVDGDAVYNQIITFDSLRKSLEFGKAGIYDEIFEVTQVDGFSRSEPMRYQVQCKIKDLSDTMRIVTIKRLAHNETIVISVLKTRNDNFLVNIYDATRHLKHLETIMV